MRLEQRCLRAASGADGHERGAALMSVGRPIAAGVLIFYAVEHFLFPRIMPGVPDRKMTPDWWPHPVLLAYAVGAVLLAGGVGLMVPKTRRAAAALAGMVLALLTLCFYVPILVTEIHTPLAVEGANYVGDTLLFAATALLAGWTANETV